MYGQHREHPNNVPMRGPPPGSHPIHQQQVNPSLQGLSHPPNMISQPPHSHQHPLGIDRVSDWLEQIKKDYGSLEHEYNLCKIHKDELERKLEGQINEFQVMHNAIAELESCFSSVKQQYVLLKMIF